MLCVGGVAICSFSDQVRTYPISEKTDWFDFEVRNKVLSNLGPHVSIQVQAARSANTGKLAESLCH